MKNVLKKTKCNKYNVIYGVLQGKKLPANIDADAEEGDVSDEDSDDLFEKTNHYIWK